jgi:iron complex outermembrane recepter protein
MTFKNSLRLGVSLLVLAAASNMASAQSTIETDIGPVELTPIDVKNQSLRPPAEGTAQTVIDPMGADVPPAADVGDLLRRTPGITGGRMGGHALEISIRGQSQNQISVIDSGSVTYGGCPNRMDPPSSVAAGYRADRIVVQRGYASVANGPGATGGAVILERDAPDLEETPRWSGTVSFGGTSNSETLDASGRVTFNMGNGFYLQGGAMAGKAGNYENGDGVAVRSGYQQKNAGLTFGYARNGVDLAFDYEKNRVDDALFAGAGMDGIYDANTIYRLRGGFDLDAGALRRIESNLFLSEVDHIMDNYSLRGSSMMGMVAPTTSDTFGGKVEAQFEFGQTRAKVGIDHQSNNRMAEGYMGPIAAIEARDPSRQIALSWPDVTIAQTGLYAETETDISDKTMVKFGLRYDRVRASSGLAAVAPTGGGMPANSYYTTQYGTTFDSPRTENNVSALVRLEHEFTPGNTFYFGLSRSVRTADANERAMARMNWVGNPDIAPEKHNQFDMGLIVERSNWNLAASAYVDRVNDYILRDAFSVSGVTTYRNVDAQLAGLELSGAWERDGWLISGDAAYTRGRNLSDDRNLAQIAPFNGKFTVSYGRDAWRGGARVNWAAIQNLIDPARDPGKTSG